MYIFCVPRRKLQTRTFVRRLTVLHSLTIPSDRSVNNVTNFDHLAEQKRQTCEPKIVLFKTLAKLFRQRVPQILNLDWLVRRGIIFKSADFVQDLRFEKKTPVRSNRLHLNFWRKQRVIFWFSDDCVNIDNNYNTNELIWQEHPQNEDQPAGHQQLQYKRINQTRTPSEWGSTSRPSTITIQTD